MKKIVVFLMGILMPVLFYAQSTIPSYGIGDRVGNLVFPRLLHHPKDSLILSEIKEPLIIIDFWESWCSGCLKTLVHLQTLQEQFPGKIKVITVTRYGTQEELLATLYRVKSPVPIRLPVVANDSVLYREFPHELLSHLVWIDRARVVRATTGSDAVTAENVTALLQGKSMNIPMKIDQLRFNYSQALLIPNPINKQPVFYSTLTGPIDGIDQKMHTWVDTVTHTRSVTFYNHTLLQLGRLALEGATAAINPKLMLGTSVPADERYTYSISLPDTFNLAQAVASARQDIGHWLQLVPKATLNKKTVRIPCLRLVKHRQGYHMAANKTISLETLLWQLNEESPNLPWVTNHTGLAGKQLIPDPQLPPFDRTFSNIRHALRTAGLDVVADTCPVACYALDPTH